MDVPARRWISWRVELTRDAGRREHSASILLRGRIRLSESTSIRDLLMERVNVHEAKTHLSRLLARVAAGEEVIIAKRGRPVARLVPYDRSPRKPGRLKGKVRIGPDFDAPLPEGLSATFRGEKP